MKRVKSGKFYIIRKDGFFTLIFCWIGIQTWPNGRKWKNDIMLKQYPYDIKRAYPFTDPRIYPITNYTFEPMD
ncbi:unnamed protein product [Cercopithifilaria johnstoni]|uniref:Uncharacterized protein n=1 Tax=Cercopithifilaria johnstoni TaxID=2874296 RepID=A0A8J2M7K1_9BILA|nr:unnamed protein product [Cercopithifilaria johnstoni]